MSGRSSRRSARHRAIGPASPGGPGLSADVVSARATSAGVGLAARVGPRLAVRVGPELAALLAGALAACGKSAPKPPEADPAEVTKLAAKMAREVPTPAAVRECTPADLDGGMPLTFRSLMLLGNLKLPARPEEADWINPTELDAPPVRTLLDAKDAQAQRRAAAELLAAPFWVAYKVDYVNAPMALQVKELKIGTVGTRIIRYEKTGLPSCVLVWFFQNDQKISDDAIAVSDKAQIDPAVAQVLRDDLRAQYIKLAPRGTKSAPAASNH